MPDEKECLCKGLGLYLAMLNAYSTLMERGMVLSEPRMAKIGEAMVKHLEAEFETPKYADHQEPTKGLLEKMQKALDEAFFGRTKNLKAMEVVRDAIHRNPVLQQMLTCGPVYTRENETRSTKIIAEAADALDESPVKAIEPLREHYEEQTCAQGATK